MHYQPISSRIALLAVAFLLFPSAFILAQGPLTPPGPPAPTMKTLQQIEPRTPIGTLPYTVNDSGSYYLTANLTGAAGSDGITILASDVTLDLNGFTMTGVGGGANSGISLAASSGNVTVRNGTLRGWGSSGVYAILASDCRFQDLQAIGNGGRGIST